MMRFHPLGNRLAPERETVVAFSFPPLAILILYRY